MMSSESHIAQDTNYTLYRQYTRDAIQEGLSSIDTPIFDRLAAPIFGRDHAL